ncbi:DUF72 domain-containing protein [Acidobacteria bacterium AB60]|nr:DUF72 domain-containing protein [Acidobacteria bacterium AB60]
MAPLGDTRIGISGWRYKGWRGSFYPPRLPQRSELKFAAEHFNTIELNGSFYSLQRPSLFESWYNETPKDFVFAVKGSRYLTHMLKLRNIEAPLANFFAQGVLRLGEKLGPILWQFPPQTRFDSERLESFFTLLPRTHKQAAELGRLHDQRLNNRTWLEVATDRPLRHAIEIRHESFACEQFIALLRKHKIALVVADTVEWPLLLDVTADFVYCRLHGSEQLYTSGYEADAIDVWARRVFSWARCQQVTDGRLASTRNAPRRSSRDVYVYFDNDAKVRAPFDALALRKAVESLSVKPVCEETQRRPALRI